MTYVMDSAPVKGKGSTVLAIYIEDMRRLIPVKRLLLAALTVRLDS